MGTSRGGDERTVTVEIAGFCNAHVAVIFRDIDPIESKHAKDICGRHRGAAFYYCALYGCIVFIQHDTANTGRYRFGIINRVTASIIRCIILLTGIKKQDGTYNNKAILPMEHGY